MPALGLQHFDLPNGCAAPRSLQQTRLSVSELDWAHYLVSSSQRSCSLQGIQSR